MSFEIRGYIEGYYGKAHTHEQRLELFKYLKKIKMNSYLYAPKDDPRHRSDWRKLYPAKKILEFKELALQAKKNGVKFIYAMSPGLTFKYSNKKDYTILLKKFKQLEAVGVKDFALLMDDIPASLSKEDKKIFDSYGIAQTFLVNKLNEELDKGQLYFCPTVYCDRFINKYDAEYLSDVSLIDSEIPFFWTGPEVISEKITGANVKAIAKIIKRKFVIWDNFHANDYSPQKLYLAPITGRDKSLEKYCVGYMTNMTELFNLNLIPLATVADYALNPSNYNAEASFKKAVKLNEKKDTGSVEFIREFLNSPFGYGSKAKKIVAKIKTTKLTVKDANKIRNSLWGIETGLGNRKLFDELYSFVYPLVIEFRHYIELLEMNDKTKPQIKRNYLIRKHELTYLVDKLAEKSGFRN